MGVSPAIVTTAQETAKERMAGDYRGSALSGEVVALEKVIGSAQRR